MKCGVSVRCVVGVLCGVLVSVHTGWSRPSRSDVGYPPTLNCSTPPDWNSESHPQKAHQDLSEDTSPKVQDATDGFTHPILPSVAQKYFNSFPRTTPDFYYSDKGSEYFDYFYEESAETDLDVEESDVSEHVQHYQPPPGLNRVAKLKLIKTPRRQPPEYMLELYDRFSRARPALTTRSPRPGGDHSDLGADIVRSFPNINKEDLADVSPGENDAILAEEHQLDGEDTRQHTLVFNITSLLTGEEVSRAELRLYTLVEQDRNTYLGEDRMVRVYEGLKNHYLPPVASRSVYGHSGGWEAFDVTSVVQAWVRKGSKTGDGVHVLDVKIDSLFQSGEKGAGTSMDIDVDPEHKEGPLLVVFSKDTTWNLQQDLQAFIDHERIDDHDSEELLESLVSSEASEESLNADNDMPSKPRTLQRAQRSRGHSLPMAADFGKPEQEEPLRRVRRDKRKRNSCRRKTMYVDFQDINWHQWIIAPPGYMAFECVGKCYVPIGAHLSPTKHAIIQTLVHAAHPKRASRACCVPTKLEPISILYLDENNIITYKYHYDDMVVAECGCR